MYCVKCNSNIPDNSTVCPYCNTVYKKSSKGLAITAYILYAVAFITIVFFALLKFTNLFTPQDKLYDPNTYLTDEYGEYAEFVEDATDEILDQYGY